MTVRVIVGVAGAGKTSTAMDIIERELRSGLRSHQIGFASFSRAATLEAAGRASELTGDDVTHLQKTGWFRTLHSCALRYLGVDTKCVLDHDSVEGKKFLIESIGSERGGDAGTLAAKVDEILSAWDFCRGRLALLRDPDGVENDSGTHTGHAGHTKCHLGQAGTHDFARLSRDFPANSLAGTHSDPLSIWELNSNSETNPRAGKCVSRGEKSEIPYIRQGKGGTVAQNRVSQSVPDGQGNQKHQCFQEKRGTDAAISIVNGSAGLRLIQTYERHKRLYGRLDFTDILMSFAGIAVRDDLTFVQSYPNGHIPEEVEVWLIDEAQDCSPLLGMVAQRLAEAARDAYWLGDRYQTVYGFSGASAAVFAALEDQAKDEGNRILLNRSWRNPIQVLEWGEEVLREDSEYEERKPFSEAEDGSAGLMEWDEFLALLPSLAGSDTMILARAWFALAKVKSRLDDAQVPWKSCQEKTSSRWECPAKIAYTLVMRELTAGLPISEQDWRRVTETLPAKWNGIELFVRGTKAKWKKVECSHEPKKTLEQVTEWGATPAFVEFVKQGKWRTDMPLLLDIAITKFGIQEVRDPSIRLGSVHSTKGLEARNIFCLAASTDRIERDCDPGEERCLRYVAITRTSKHYRLVVDQNDQARGRSLFWAAPKGETKYLRGFDDAGIRHSIKNPAMVPFEDGDLRPESQWGDVRDDGGDRSGTMHPGVVRRDRSEDRDGKDLKDADLPEGQDDFGWLSI